MHKRNLWAFALALAVMVGLSGCSSRRNEGGASLWYTADLAHWDNATTALEATPYTGEMTVPALMEALLSGPDEGSGLISPFPEGTNLQQFKQEGKRVTVDLSWPYADLVGIELTLADYCITLTLTQLEGVDEVCITANGGQLPYRDRQVFTAQDVMFTGAEEEPVEVTAALHFRRSDSRELGFEFRVFRLTESDSVAQVVLEALIAGPQDEGLEPVLPANLKVLSARLEGKVCYVDLSGVFLEQIPQEEWEQQMVIDSLVNTLCSMENVEQVQILVEGQLLEWYGDVLVNQPDPSEQTSPGPT